MSDASLFRPVVRPPRVRVYPQREDTQNSIWERLETATGSVVGARFPEARGRRFMRTAGLAARYEPGLRACGDAELGERVRALRRRLRGVEDWDDRLVAASFAIVREVSHRTVGQRHHDEQIAAGHALLAGNIAEMDTGEGKTLAASLPAASAAMAGTPVHVITVNDYLADRDAESLRPLYEFLGLSVGTVVAGQSREERRAAYACDVTYCTNKELAFDYLRDRLAIGEKSGNLRLQLDRMIGSDAAGKLVLGGLHFAIVDEADSILVDEARTPLILSGHADAEADREAAETALGLADALTEGVDYKVSTSERRIELTERGKRHLESLSDEMEGLWRSRVLREERAVQALSARLLYHRDEHYLVRDGKVQIIDEFTGRVMEDRFWGEGLHQIIELKEDCEVSARRITHGRMTYQRFFRRYMKLSGMTGTAREIAGELWSVYRLPVARIPTHAPPRRTQAPDQVVATQDRKWDTITRRVAELNARGQPVLLGTRSVAASERASACLTAAGLAHVVLNAAQDSQEAEIIAQAGQRGRITVATNMAGRGTDIRLGEGVAELGGLCVLMSERHEAGRIDRQLRGRCGRQGDPGHFETILALDDPLVEAYAWTWARGLTRLLRPIGGGWLGRGLIRMAQWRAERVHSRMRRELLRADRQLGNMLAFSGTLE